MAENNMGFTGVMGPLLIGAPCPSIYDERLGAHLVGDVLYLYVYTSENEHFEHHNRCFVDVFPRLQGCIFRFFLMSIFGVCGIL